MDRASLVRSPLARLRTSSFSEGLSWVLIVVAVASARQLIEDGNLAALLFGALGVSARVAVSTEDVRCDERGVSWRTVFNRRFVSWDEVYGIEIEPFWRPFRLTPKYNVHYRCLVVRTAAGILPVKASIWCSLRAQLEFIAEARLMSPPGWVEVEGRPAMREQ